MLITTIFPINKIYSSLVFTYFKVHIYICLASKTNKEMYSAYFTGRITVSFSCDKMKEILKKVHCIKNENDKK
jgi:hypothetical protein